MKAVKDAISKSRDTIRSAYSDINTSTLSGAIDIIVIEHPDGIFKSSPFYVRFGKMGTLKPADKIVDIHLNGQFLSHLHMKLGRAGEAYFVESINRSKNNSFFVESDDEYTQNDLDENNISDNGNHNSPSYENFKTFEKRQKRHSENDVYLEDIINSDEFMREYVYSGQEIISNKSNPKIFNEFRLSLCGYIKDQNFDDKFNQYLVSYEEFMKNPHDIINNTNLVVLINGRYYNWDVAAPILVSNMAFQAELPEETVQSLKNVHMSEKRHWTGWFRRYHMESSSNEMKSPNREFSPDKNKTLPKRIRLTSEEIVGLNLKSGHNDITFTMTSKYQGTTVIPASIYLWKWYEKLVIADIDGTITKSDVRGQVMTMLGRDWTQANVGKLFNKIADNDYRFIYMSARAIGQSGVTRAFLKDIEVPDGAIMLSPSSTYVSLHREIVEKRPEDFKIPCLNDVRSLFPDNVVPFFAGFGNRANDVIAYKSVGIDSRRIFTVNSKGSVINDSWPRWITSYGNLAELIDYFFQYQWPPSAANIIVDMLDEFMDIDNMCTISDAPKVNDEITDLDLNI